MKIAILSCFYPYRGGISQFNTYLLRELSKRHNVKGFNFTRQYPALLFPGKTQYVAKDDDAVSTQSEAVLDTANPFSYLSAAKKIASWEPDVLITRYWMSYFAPSLGSVGRRVKSLVAKQMQKNGKSPSFKNIAIMDNVIPHERRFFDTPFTKYYIKGQDGIVTLSGAVERELKELSPISRVKTIPHPIYNCFGEREDTLTARRHIGIIGSDTEIMSKKVLLFFGLIREYKGLDILLKALPLLDDSYIAVVAGEPYGSFAKYQEIIDSPEFAPCKQRLLLNLNYIPDGEVKHYFSAADVSVLPYRSATQSGISSISWNFDVPLITTPVGDLVESVAKAGTGIVTEEITPHSLAKAIEDFFAQNNKEHYIYNISSLKQRLSWEGFALQLEEFITELGE